MNRARARRRDTQWGRYVGRYARPDNGGLIDNRATPGWVRSAYRRAGRAWTWRERYAARLVVRR